MSDKKLKILLAPNSFKECASSVNLVKLLQEYLYDEKFELCPFPISDGGDGFLDVCNYHFNLEILNFFISTPFDESKIKVQVGFKKETQTIYIESAKVLGMNLIPKNLRKPINLSSKGLGELLLKIQNKNKSGELKVKKIIIGMGGTGTNDLGVGMCSQLGLKLYNNQYEVEAIPASLNLVDDVSWLAPNFAFEIEIITDVDNPLLGMNGATYTFGGQKGSTKEDSGLIESGFENLISQFNKKNLWDSSKFLSGAAGGLAAAFQIFFNSSIRTSNNFVLNDLNVKKFTNINGAITGEGAFDEQSFMNKAPGIIINYFKDKTDKIFIITGCAAPNIKKLLPPNAEIIELSSFFISTEESIRNYEIGLQKACTFIKSKQLN